MQVIQSGLDLTILPEVHRRTLVWIHGFNDTAQLFCEDFVKEPLVSDCKVVLPTAELRRCNDGKMARSWYNRTANFEADNTIEESVNRINSILIKESESIDCLMIGGFSQGAVMALLCGLSRYQGPISAVIALSGFVLPMNIPIEKRSTPVLMYHGAQDNRISLQTAIRTSDKYLSQTNYHLEVHPTMPHEVYLEEYTFIRNWLKIKLNI